MPVVTRHFGVTATGTGDGTSAENRAALFVSGTINSIIRGHNFAADALDCIIQPGTYTQSVGLDASSFTVSAPNRATNRLLFRATNYAKSSWRSCDREEEFPALDVIFQSSTGGYSPWSSDGTAFAGIRFEYSNLNGIIVSPGSRTIELYGCHVINSANGTQVGCVGGNGTVAMYDCLCKVTGTTYNTVVAAVNAYNCRFIGNLNATTGNRFGAGMNAGNQGRFANCVFSNMPTRGISPTISNPNFPQLLVENCVIHTVGDGIFMTDTPTNTQAQTVVNSFIVASAGNGIRGYQAQNLIMNNRIRASGTALVNMDGAFTSFNDSSAGSDAAEFVDAANGDFRISRMSRYWGRNLGAGDQPYHSLNLRTGFQS